MRLDDIWNALGMATMFIIARDKEDEYPSNCPVDIRENKFVISNFYYGCTSTCEYNFDVKVIGHQKPYHRQFHWLSRCSGQTDFADYAHCEFGKDFLSKIDNERNSYWFHKPDVPRGERRVFAYISHNDSVLHLKYLNTRVEDGDRVHDFSISNSIAGWIWGVPTYKSTKYYYTAQVPVYMMMGPDHAKQATHFEVEETACYSEPSKTGYDYYHYENEDQKGHLNNPYPYPNADEKVDSDEEYRANEQPAQKAKDENCHWYHFCFN